MTGQVISIHSYMLRNGVTREMFHRAVQEAVDRNLFELPGLDRWWFADTIKGPLQAQACSVLMTRAVRPGGPCVGYS